MNRNFLTVNMKEKNEFFETNDFWLAVFLKAKGSKLVNIVWNEKKAVFSFSSNSDIKELIEKFYNGGLVSITAIKSSYDDLKSALKNFKR